MSADGATKSKEAPKSNEQSPQKSGSKETSPKTGKFKSEPKERIKWKKKSPSQSISPEGFGSNEVRSAERSKLRKKSSKRSKSRKGSSKKSKSREKSRSRNRTPSRSSSRQSSSVTSRSRKSRSKSSDGDTEEQRPTGDDGTLLSTATSATSPTFGETKTATTTATSLVPRAEMQSPAPVPVLGYWNIRGLAEPARYLLKYKGVAFEDRRYNFGPAPGYDFGEWGNVKANLGLRYPGLPYYIDGDVKLTQSIAIMRYLGRKHSLVGRCEEDLQEVDLMEQQVCELRWGLGRVIFSLDFEASRKRYIEMLPKTLEIYSIYFRVKRWVLGDDISYVDFMMYETLDWIRVFHAEALAGFEALTDYCARFEALPGVGEYRTSAQFVSWPIFGPLAKWGFRERPQI